MYHAQLYRTPGSPLHFLQLLRDYYASTFGDQFFAADTPAAWFAMFGYMELILHMPVALWAVFSSATRLRRKEGLGGMQELVLLCYSLQTAITTATCIYEILSWDEAITSPAQKKTLVFGLYGPYLALREFFLAFYSIYFPVSLLVILFEHVFA